MAATATTDALDVLSVGERVEMAQRWREVLDALPLADDAGMRALIESGCVALEGAMSVE